MAARSLNRVQLIGNLTRDPELRYTPQGTAVCSFGLATNRSWTTDTGERREETEFHRIVSWNKLAELCAQLCTKGRKVYLEGRLSTRTWTGKDGTQRTTTEIVIDDMILLDNKRPEMTGGEAAPVSMPENKIKVEEEVEPITETEENPAIEEVQTEEEKAPKKKKAAEEINPDDIPF